MLITQTALNAQLSDFNVVITVTFRVDVTEWSSWKEEKKIKDGGFNLTSAETFSIQIPWETGRITDTTTIITPHESVAGIVFTLWVWLGF